MSDLTREQLEENYRTNEIGCIASPGKYEGEPLYVPYLWENYVLHGFSTETISTHTETAEVVEITDDIVDEFPELSDVDYVSLEESDSGFVYSSELSEAELEELRERAKRIREREEELREQS